MIEEEFFKQRLLIVDDDPASLALLESALIAEYIVVTATSGAQTIELISDGNRPDLILLDILMPDMDGYQTLKRLKADPATQNIPIVFLTGKDEIEAEVKGFELGAIDYITKPFNIPVVLARVRSHLKFFRQAALLEKVAMIDPVTEVANRRNYDLVIDREWRRAMREETALTLVLFDIDYFSLYNTHYGHQAGDACFTLVARALSATFTRPGDFIARHEGGALAVILPSTDEKSAARVIGSVMKILEKLGIEHEFSEISDLVTVSVGACSTMPSQDSSPSELFDSAAKALNKAKVEGRNRSETVTI